MMSDIEGPPTKIIKMDVAPLSMDSTMEGQEDQEEWLSEGVLTDDDYLAGNISQEQAQKPMDETLNLVQSLEPEMPQPVISEVSTESVKMEQNIEDTLNNFENMGNENSEKNDAFDQLLKKDDKESDVEHSEKHSDDDGHNTDDLLRMLGGDDSKKKKVLSSIRDKNARRRAPHSSDDDDDYIFEGAKVTRLKVAKNALMRKPAAKAEPEDLSDKDSDMSEEDVNTVKKMFTTKPRAPAGGGGAPTPARPYTSNIKTEKPKPPLKQYTNKSNSLLKPQEKKEPEEIINEEEFLEDDDFDLDDDMGSMSSMGSSARDAQLIRRPERMDEEPPSDPDSQDDSDYDVMPSSDSEDMDDWFTLDIRAERAGDYLPWLGDKAHKLLTEEKHRVSARLAALGQSVNALRSTERVQRDQIKVATEALHELDAMLAAA